MTLRRAVVMVPVRPVKGDTSPGDVTHPWHAGQIELVPFQVGSHVPAGLLALDAVLALGGVPLEVAGGGSGAVYRLPALVSGESLAGQVDFNSFIGPTGGDRL